MKHIISGVYREILPYLLAAKEKIFANAVNSVVENVNTSVSSVGTFAFARVRDKFVRMISINAYKYSDMWMEDALYGILRKYNDFNKKGNLQVMEVRYGMIGSDIYMGLADGIHQLRYRKWDIILTITSTPKSSGTGVSRNFTIMALTKDRKFADMFERDMMFERDHILKFNPISGKVKVFKEEDGYWEASSQISYRPLRTIYLDNQTKRTIVDTVNRFFSEKEYYRKHAIPHNLKIVLYGLPGTGKDSIARMIASEWRRNIYLVESRNGHDIPDQITKNDVYDPLFLISDIDKYPFLINEDIALSNDADEENLQKNKNTFGRMINALDGVNSGEDRIIIMTTNHIEKFSPTFLRPGRVDLCLEIKPVGPEAFRNFVKDYYNKDLKGSIKLKSDTLSIAEMQADVVFRRISYEEFCDKYLA
jgi:hypothetical protein